VSLPPGADSPVQGHDEFLETFDYPFSELLVWAVLTKRKEMAKLMWQHGEPAHDQLRPITSAYLGEQAMSKALVASRLCQAMAHEAADDDLDVEIFEEFTKFGEQFERLCKEILL